MTRANPKPPPPVSEVELPAGTPVSITVIQQEPPPVFLSQRNCETRGLSPAHFLRALRDSQLPVTELGHLRLVETAVFDEWLRSQGRVRTVQRKKSPPAEDSAAAMQAYFDRNLKKAGGRRID